MAKVKSIVCQTDVNVELSGGFAAVDDAGFAVYTLTPAERPERAKPQLRLCIYDHRPHVLEMLRRYRIDEQPVPFARLTMAALEAIQLPARAVVVKTHVAGDPRNDWFHVNLSDVRDQQPPQAMLYGRVFTRVAPGEVRDSRAHWCWSRAIDDGGWRHALVALTDAVHPVRIETTIAGMPRELVLGSRADLSPADPCGEALLEEFPR